MQYIRRKGIVRSRDLEALGIPREYLLRLRRQGKLSRTGRGLYTLPDAAVTCDNVLAFLNPDGTKVALVRNELPNATRVQVQLPGRTIDIELPPDSLGTLSIKA